MAGESDGLFEGVAVLVVESALAGSEDDGSNEGGQTTSHVDNTGSGKVNVSNSTEGVVTEGSQETVARPDGTDDDGVDKGGKEARVAQVGSHLTTLGNGTGDNGGCSGGESELEEETSVVVELTEEEVAVTNEGTVRGVISTVGKTISQSPESKSTTTSIQQVLKKKKEPKEYV